MVNCIFHYMLVIALIMLNGCNIKKETEEDIDTSKSEEPKEETEVDVEADTELSTKPDEEALLRQQMQDDVVALWKMYLTDHDTSSRDKRWDVLDDYAESLVRHVRHYQEEGVEERGEMVYLPEHENVHLLIATMVTFETALWHEVVGSRGEVGLLQVHGVALNGFNKKTVINNPDLGLKLGIRWLTKQIPYCNVPSSEDWTDDDWLGVLSIYGGGVNRARKNGKCLKFRVSKKRVEYTKFYRDRINRTSDIS